jgi:glycosyltransferase involved in cell wall biosynthesis
MKTISVVIPTLNSAKTILACLGSLATQTWDNFEVLIQDGQSTDETLATVADFHRLHPALTIRVHREKDRGIYDAMNRSLRHVEGEWVYFLGSDDRLFAPDTLRTVAAALTDDVDVVYGDVTSPVFNGRYAGRFCIQSILRCNICHQALFVRRRLYDSLGGFDPRFRVLADWEHNMRWFLSPRVRVRYIDLVIAEFAAGGLSSTAKDAVMEREKVLLYVRHGSGGLPFRMKARLVYTELRQAAERRDWRHLLRALRACPAVLMPSRPLPR